MIGAAERVGVAKALADYLAHPAVPGGPPRRVRRGVPADLCLLHVPLREALRHPAEELVRRVFHGVEHSSVSATTTPSYSS